MALIKCPECNSEVSNMATACPKCGYPISMIIDDANAQQKCDPDRDVVISDPKDKKKKPWGPWIGIVALVVSLVNFFTDPVALTVIIAITVIAAVIFSFVKKCKLKGFAIVALILSCGLLTMITVYTINIKRNTVIAQQDYTISEYGYSYTVPKEFGMVDIGRDKLSAVYTPNYSAALNVTYLYQKLNESEVETALNNYDIGAAISEAYGNNIVTVHDRERLIINGNQALRSSVDYVDAENEGWKSIFTTVYNSQSNYWMVVILIQRQEVFSVNTNKYRIMYNEVIDSITTYSVEVPVVGINPSFKADVDELLELIDEYDVFMEKYETYGYSQELMDEYSGLFDELDVIDERIDELARKYPESNMSPEDLEYLEKLNNRLEEVDSKY